MYSKQALGGKKTSANTESWQLEITGSVSIIWSGGWIMPMSKQVSLTPFSDSSKSLGTFKYLLSLHVVCMCAVEDTVGCLGVLWECFRTLFFLFGKLLRLCEHMLHCLKVTSKLNPASLLWSWEYQWSPEVREFNFACVAKHD